MILFIIAAIILVVGVWKIIYNYCKEGKWGRSGFIMFWIGAISMLFIIVGCIDVLNINATAGIQYDQDKAFIERCYDNEGLTGAEVIKVVDLIIKDNNLILIHRRMIHNPFIGMFYSGALAALKPFDMSRIKNANLNVSTDLQIEMELDYGDY